MAAKVGPDPEGAKDEIPKPAWEPADPTKSGGIEGTGSQPIEGTGSQPIPLKKQRTSQAAMFGFADPETIKARVRESLTKPDPYDVFNFYHEKGYAQFVAKHPIFENVTLGVITLNAIYIAIDTDWNRADQLPEYDWYFQVMEQLFCIYFTWEWIVRFCAFKRKLNGLKDAWFVFDSCLVFLMVMETWVMVIILSVAGGKSPLGNTAMLRLLRLLRLSRLMRMLRSLPELMILVKGMMSAMKSVFYVMCLLVILTYVFAIAFTQLSVDTPTIGETYFANVAFGMYSLLIYATFLDDLSNLMDDLRHDKWPLVFVALIFICLASMTVMNMLIGVLCEVVDAVAQTEKYEMLQTSSHEKLYQVAKRLDTNFNGKISYAEFQLIVEDKTALAAMTEVGVNPTGVVDFAELFFFEDDRPSELPFDAFMDMILSLREENKATVKDVLDLWRRIKDTAGKDIIDMQSKMNSIQKKMEEKFSNIDSKVNDLMGLTNQLKAKQ
jgi:voltage-gated sodium channel